MKQSKLMIAGGLVASMALVAGLAWTASAERARAVYEPQAAKIAVVDMIGLVDKMMSQGSFLAARQQFDAAQTAKQQAQKDFEQQIQAEYGAIQSDAAAKTEAATTDDAKAKVQEETKAKMDDLQARYMASQDAVKQMQAEADTFTTNTLVDAYDLVNEAVTKMATERGYTHVLTSRTEPMPRDRGAQIAFQEILLRHVAILPKGDDLTKDLEKELKIDAVTPVGPGAPGAPGAAPGAEPEMKLPEPVKEPK